MARRWKGLIRNMDKTREQGWLLQEMYVLEFDIMPQLKLSWVEIGLRLTKELQRLLESENIPECRVDKGNCLQSLGKLFKRIKTGSNELTRMVNNVIIVQLLGTKEQ